MGDHQAHPEHFARHERPEGGDGREWSIGVGDTFRVNHPARLFVYAEPGKQVELREAEVTSWNTKARQLEGGGEHWICLSDDEIRFLLDVLPKALALRNQKEAAEPCP